MDKRLKPEKRLGLVLRQFRHDAGLSQEELSFRCELHRTYIGAVERGEVNIALRNLVTISHALGTSVAVVAAAAEL